MADIDMIPRLYRHTARVERTLRGFAVAMVVLLGAGVAASALLHWRIGQNDTRLAQLRIDSARMASGSAQLDAARTRKALLAQASASLAALRGDNDPVRMADALDAALAEGVWFDQLSFTRDAQLLGQASGAVPNAAQTTQLVLAALPGASVGAESWQLARRIEVTGSAVDYNTLTALLGRLAAQKAFSQVRLVRSSAAVVAPGAGGAGSEAARPAAGIDFAISAVFGATP